MFLDCFNRYFFKQSECLEIPDMPLAYWESEESIAVFKHKKLGEILFAKTGVTTGDNDIFLRLWFEVSQDSWQRKWFPLNKGGEYRKWYGNNEYVINWEHNGLEIKHFPGSTIRNEEFYFREGVTWSKITAAKFSARYSPATHMFDAVGLTCFSDGHIPAEYILAYLCSCVAQKYVKVLNQTVSYTVGTVNNLPFIYNVEQSALIADIARACINSAKTDWDSFETSWEFQMHPLVRYRIMKRFFSINEDGSFTEPVSYTVQDAFEIWKEECENRFRNQKENEEKLNRLFIDIFSLHDELTPGVEDKDVTLHHADLGRDIRSLISYAVGCMFGRYSTDEPGLIFAGDNFGDYYVTLNEPVGEYLDRVLTVDHDKVTVDVTVKTDCGLLNHNGKQIKLIFPPDADGIIPITDDEYFNDDIVSMFVRWLERVFGRETLEENLKFIADALGGKGTPRDVIRQYFLNDFYKDHLKIYQKRPIYWLFDSGKRNGFKCLIYMHRYQPDTLARIRTDYLHELQGRYRNAIETLERQIAGASTSERVKLQKRLTALKAQAEEARVYEEKIHHLADQMIKIDLDDGVKHNYALFKDVLAPIK